MKRIPGFAVEADALVPCACGAKIGKPCVPTPGKPWPPGQVHFGRRVRRLMLTVRATAEQREKIEQNALDLLRDGLQKRATTAKRGSRS